MKEKTKTAPAELQDLRLYTLEDIRPILGVSHKTLVRYMTSGKLQATKIGGKWRVSRPNLDKFLNGE